MTAFDRFALSITSSGRSQLETSEPSVHTTTRERPDCARVVVNATYTPSMTAVRPDGVKLRSASRTASKSLVSGILGITA